MAARLRVRSGGVPTGKAADVHPAEIGIYLHVPFCARRCGYCSFVTSAPAPSTAAAAHRMWARAAKAEIAMAARELGPTRPAVATVYLGGGTPTEVHTAVLVEVLDELRRSFEVRADVEISVEANPDGLRDGQIAELVAMGATRISIGMQSAVPRVLALLDRTHDPDSVPRAVDAARAAGIRSVSLDLIHGTPGETEADWARTVEVALGLEPEHLSAYALSIEPATKLAARVRSGTLPDPSPDDAADRYEALDAAAMTAGLRWYELSNWARTAADRCRHNLGYWRDGDWWGIGPGAHSHVDRRRWWNHASLGTWARSVHDGSVPAAGAETASIEEQHTEQLMLGIRLAEGVPMGWAAPGSAQALAADGLVEIVDGRIVLTLRGRLLADLVARRLRWGDRPGSSTGSGRSGDQKVVDSRS
ncbi:MAG: coproporphyrinogen III oxidase [Actinobacteria bacterium]|nr:coproporphyrinogen III oxidase [Actinomycetota bacterium]